MASCPSANCDMLSVLPGDPHAFTMGDKESFPCCIEAWPCVGVERTLIRWV